MDKLINPVTTPLYDDVYREGIKWLDRLAQSPCLFDDLDPNIDYCLSCSCPQCSPR